MTREINDAASLHLARAAKEAGVRTFAFSSSRSTYRAAGDFLHDEKSALYRVTPYAKSKAIVEREIASI